MTAPGQYTEVLTRGGYSHGAVIPPHQVMYVRLAPAEEPAAAVAFARPGGTDIYWWAGDLDDVTVSVDSRQYFGFGLGGIVASGVASALDTLLAPWSMYLRREDGDWLEVYAQRGPAPHATLLAHIQARSSAAIDRSAEVEAFRGTDDHRQRIEELLDEVDHQFTVLCEAARDADPASEGDVVKAQHVRAALLGVDWQDFAADVCGRDWGLVAKLRIRIHQSNAGNEWFRIDETMPLRWIARQLDREYLDDDACYPDFADAEFPAYPPLPLVPFLDAPHDLTASELAAARLSHEALSAAVRGESADAVVDTRAESALLMLASRVARIAACAQLARGGEGAEQWLDRSDELQRLAEAGGADYSYYQSSLDSIALQLMEDLVDYPYRGPDWSGRAIALCGASHRTVVDLRAHLWLSSLASPDETTARLLAGISGEIAACLEQLEAPRHHDPDFPPEHVQPR